MPESLVSLSEEVQTALDHHQPVVALESTILSHGMPYPQNLATARELDYTIRGEGAIPATIAIDQGRILVGVTLDQLQEWALPEAERVQEIHKVSSWNLAQVLARKQRGATTVATTMLAASLVGIKVFATGGIGGVHRGVNESFDISNDLQQLARTPVCVVCAGVKSILAVAKTIEYLETMGVPVNIWRSQEFPGFFHCQSGQFLDHAAIDDSELMAQIMIHHWQLNHQQGGLVLAVPFDGQHQLPKESFDQALKAALSQADKAGIVGKAVTPFLLAAIEKHTGGTSLQVNQQLVVANARVAAQLAGSYARSSRLKSNAAKQISIAQNKGGGGKIKEDEFKKPQK